MENEIPMGKIIEQQAVRLRVLEESIRMLKEGREALITANIQLREALFELWEGVSVSSEASDKCEGAICSICPASADDIHWQKVRKICHKLEVRGAYIEQGVDHGMHKNIGEI